MAATVAGTSFLFLLKSTIRYLRLWPPPRCHTVVSPRLFLPPLPERLSVSARSGFFFVRSSMMRTVMPLRPGEVGL